MNKAEKYLSERMDFMSNERVMLLTKIDETDLHIKEIEYKIRDLKNSIDDAFEIFSPRTRKNDFIKNEIDCLEKEIDALTSLRDEYKDKAGKVLEDIDIIREALRESIDEETENENNASMIDYSDDKIAENNDLYDNNGTEKLVIEKERLLLAGGIEEKTLQSISNLIYKCEMCEKLLETDTGRVRLEIEMMNKELNKLYSDIRVFTGELKKSVGVNEESVKKAPVKKLSKDNLHKGN